ncbi:MAG: hypothetical protein IKU07_09465, partial [Oscillospiraceae bacterium]|nr:hypothetical protein [Oscillospiraceae bacterium]
MAKNIKKLLSFVLALVMVLSMIPAVYAADETTEPEGTTPPATTEPAADAIQIGTADDWHNWFMRNTNNLIKDYGNKDEVAKFAVTADIRTTPNNLYYFGTNAGVTVKAEIDLGGHTLTITGTNTSRVFGIYDNSQLTIKNGTIVLDKPFANVNGGLFLVNKGSVVLENVNIDDIGEYEFGYNGKLMQISSGCTATMTNCNISSNTKASTSRYAASGALATGIGAMIVINGTLNATNCTFTASKETNATTNDGLPYYGGMIAHQSGAAGNYTNCTFEGGYGRYGGALCIRAGTTNISGCTFKDNKAINGGAVYVSGGTVNITDTAFENTCAASFADNNFGGALDIEGGSVTVKNAEFTGNTANYGGAIHIGTSKSDDGKKTYYGYLKLEDSTITGATASGRGGGIHVFNAKSSATTLEMINTDITGCSAPYGGGVACFGTSKTIITGGTISNCTATQKGGGLSVQNSGYSVDTNVVTVTDTVFDGSTASEAGNVYVNNTKRPNVVDFYNVTMRNGVATCTAASGDAYAGNIYVAGVDLTYNEVLYHCTVNLTGCTIEGGKSAKVGANVGVAGVTTLNIIDCTIRNGESVTSGGNVYSGNQKAVTNIYNTVIANGTAANGGNIRIGGGRINIYDCDIQGGDGAGIGRSIYINANGKLYVYGGDIDATGLEKPFATAAGGTLQFLNANVIGADPTAFVPYGEAAVIATGENAYTVKHLAVDGATTKEGTCEEAGTVTIVCPTCEHTYVYENVEGHAIVIEKAVAATCTEAGLTEGQHCALCDYAVAQEVIPAAGHVNAEAVKENEVPHT